VLFDSGHGRTHFDFDVAARLLEEGFPPDLLSTDISLTSARDLSPGLVTVMNKWIALRLSVPDAIQACTVRPADSLFRGALFGRLKPGWDADIAVLAQEEGDFAYSDAAGRVLRSSSRLVPAMTVRMGQLVWRAP
jgi:dihydroorotase